MTSDEAQVKAKELEKLNLAIWQAFGEPEKISSLRSQFKAISNEICAAGFKIRRWKEYDPFLGRKVPRFRARVEDASAMNIVNNQDKNGYNIGDCTTRCISFCTGLPYLSIQKEQFANAAKEKAKGYNVSWRTTRIWTQSLLSRGFCRIDLPRKVSRKVFIRLFKDSGINEGIIATRSSGHVAAIDMKEHKVLDTWNSSGGRIMTIFVPSQQKDIWQRKVNALLG